MKILEAYHRLGLQDPLKFYRGIKDPDGNFRGSGKTTRIAIEMALDIYDCNDPNTKFIVLFGDTPEWENLYLRVEEFLRVLCPQKIQSLNSRFSSTEVLLRGLTNGFVYSDPRNTSDPIRHARKVFTFEKNLCRVLNRDDVAIWEGNYSKFLDYLECHNLSVDNVTTGNRMWNLRYFWKA